LKIFEIVFVIVVVVVVEKKVEHMEAERRTAVVSFHSFLTGNLCWRYRMFANKNNWI